MSYRDEDSAKGARIDALEDEVRALREENERLKNPPTANASPPSSSEDNANRELLEKNLSPRVRERLERARAMTHAGFEPTAPTPQPPRSAGRLPKILGLVFLGLALSTVPMFLPLDMGSGAGVFPVLVLVFSGPAVALTLYRVTFPSDPILAKDEHNNSYEVHRPMKTRKLHLGLASGTYLLAVAAIALMLALRR